MTEASNPPFVIEKIKPRTWALHVRDTRTDEIHELELRGDGPWRIDLSSIESSKVQKQIAPPPDDAITLRLQRAAGNIRVAAIGRGAKAWTAAQGTLLGSKWFLDSMGAPVTLLQDRPTLVEDIRAALPSIALDLSKYTDDVQSDLPAARAPAAPSQPALGPKKGGRGFGGKIDLPPDEDIQLVLSNAGRSDNMVNVTATSLQAGVSAEAVRVWVEQRAASIGSWQPLDGAQVVLVQDSRTLPEDLHKAFPQVRLDVRLYYRPGVQDSGARSKVAPEDMKYPEVIASLDRQDPRAITILHDIIRQIAEVFIVVPLVSGHGYRSVELLTDRPTGIYDGLPIGTSLLQVRLRHDADPTLSATDWAPLKKTLRALGRPEKQFQMLREYVADVLTKAGRTARERGEARSETKPEPAAARSRGRKKARPEPGPGPGGLSWEPASDRGAEGLSARWGEGQFKLLHVGDDRYGLFYEHDGGGFESISCGSLDEGKRAAGERVDGTRAAAPLDTQAARLVCAPGRKAGIPANEEITLHLRRSSENSAAVIIHVTGERVHEWVFAHPNFLGREWVRRDDNIPEVTIHDSQSLLADLRKEFPGVNLDTTDFKKPRRASASEPEKLPAEQAVPAETNAHAEPEPQSPPAQPAGDETNQDAELLRSIKSQLADMLDEED